MPGRERTDIFISYSRSDVEIARRFASALEAEGFRVWWDETLHTGDAYDEVTEKALKEAKAVIVIWSRESVQSRWVRAEATIADRNKALMPVMIEPCDRPIMFELTQTADLSAWAGAADDHAWTGFLSDLKEFVGRERAVAPERRATPPATHAGGPPTLAILPFANRSGVADDQVFAEGIVEDLIDALSSSLDLRVLSSGITGVYRDKPIELRTVARECSADFLLEGNVRRGGERLRVSAELADGATGKVLWSQRFDRPLSELSALQEDIAVEIAGNLNVRIQREEIQRALRKPEDLSAWASVVRAIGALSRPSVEGMKIAVDEAKRAVAIDPDLGVAHAILSQLLASRFILECGVDRSLLGEIRRHLDRAIELDGENPRVLFHSVTAYMGLADFPAAHRQAERAVQASPYSGVARTALGLLLVMRGRVREAVSELAIAERLSLHGPAGFRASIWRAIAHLVLGEPELAASSIERSAMLNPSYFLTDIVQAALAMTQGDAEAAKPAIVRLRTREPSLPVKLQMDRLRLILPENSVFDLIATPFARAWRET